MPSTTPRLQGVFTPNMVPLDAEQRINEPELRRYVDWLIARGVHGLYPNGSTGEFLRFTADERRQIIRIVCEQTAGRVPVLAGAAEANVRETLAACEAYHEYGAAAVAIVSPFYYRLSPSAVYEYFAEIARHTPIDVTLYNIPVYASPIVLSTTRRLAEAFPRIVGIKDSTGDVAAMARLIEHIRPVRPDFCFLTGWDPVLVPMMVMGADGGTHASSGIAPELTRRVYDLVRAGNLQAAVALQRRVMTLFDAMLDYGDFPDGFRVAAEMRGFAMGRSRQPSSAPEPQSCAAIERELKRALAASEVDASSAR